MNSVQPMLTSTTYRLTIIAFKTLLLGINRRQDLDKNKDKLLNSAEKLLDR